MVGGAEAVHQYHGSADPPVGHLADIVRNANLFADRWGWWPMEGWLEAFRTSGLAERGLDGRWTVTSAPAERGVAAGASRRAAGVGMTGD